MDLNELLVTYSREEATLRFAAQNGFEIEMAEFYIAIALGEISGDVLAEASPGSKQLVPLPQPPDDLQK